MRKSILPCMSVFQHLLLCPTATVCLCCGNLGQKQLTESMLTGNLPSLLSKTTSTYADTTACPAPSCVQLKQPVNHRDQQHGHGPMPNGQPASLAATAVPCMLAAARKGPLLCWMEGRFNRDILSSTKTCPHEEYGRVLLKEAPYTCYCCRGALLTCNNFCRSSEPAPAKASFRTNLIAASNPCG